MEGEPDLCDWELPPDTSAPFAVEADQDADGTADCITGGQEPPGRDGLGRAGSGG